MIIIGRFDTLEETEEVYLIAKIALCGMRIRDMNKDDKK